MTRQDIVPVALRTYGGLQLGQGAWMIIAPGSFFDAIGPFGARNDHYTRDAATWSIALGVLLLLAAARGGRGARAALLLLAAVQAGLHTVNHIADAGIADPGWVGVFDAVSLGAITLALLAVWRLATSTATAMSATTTSEEVRS
jgi:hypothetical protein